MLKPGVTMWTVIVLAASFGCATAAPGQATTQPVKPLRIGTYDPRAVAVAWAASKQFNAGMKEKFAERDRAKQAGDQQKVAELEAWGKAQQHKLHLQGFSAAPVDDILVKVKDQLPAVAQRAGVDAIVGNMDYVVDQSAVADVTHELVKVFEPSEKTLKTIQELREREPVPAEAVKTEENRGKI